MEAIVFIGAQASGKSTFYARHFASTHLRLSRDMLRTAHRLDVLFHAALAVKQPIVLDNTHPVRTSRARYVNGGRAAGYRVIAYWFDTTAEAALARNEARVESARVPELAIRGVLAKLEPPSPDEHFDMIYRVTIDAPDYVVELLHPST
jgi:predicted kinase